MNELTSQTVETDETPTKTKNPMDRFSDKYEVMSNGCWRWKACFNDREFGQYGRFYYEGKFWVAHRWMYEMTHGSIPDGLVLDHFMYPQDGCIGPRCVNPDHLKPVTPRENTLRGNTIAARNARKTACPRGHEYDRVDTRGFRVCTLCYRQNKQERQMRQKAWANITFIEFAQGQMNLAETTMDEAVKRSKEIAERTTVPLKEAA